MDVKQVSLSMVALIAGVTLLGTNRGFAQETKSERHVFLVDVSGSMDAKPPRSKFSHLALRKKKLKEWFAEHPSSSVTLMSFYSEIQPEITYNLGSSVTLANAWVDGLTKRNGGTHLWKCLGTAVDRAYPMARDNPNGFVMVHVFTDGLDTERISSLDKVISNRQNAQTLPMPPASQELGDFDVKVLSTVAPIPQSEAIPTPSASTQTPSPGPTLMPTAIPSASSVANSVAFEIQEPRIVSGGQLVHFINKTSPFADSYSWTIRYNKRPADPAAIETDAWWLSAWRNCVDFVRKCLGRPVRSASAVQHAEESGEIELSDEHPVHPFRNSGKYPQSYSVFLVARYGLQTVSAPPITVLVQAPTVPPSRSERVMTFVTRGLSGLGGTAGIVGIIGLVLRVRELKKANGPPAEIRRSQNRLRKMCGMTAIFLLAFLFSTWDSLLPSAEAEAVAAEKSSVEAAARAQAISRSSAPAGQPASGAQPNINIVTAPSERLANEAATATAPGQGPSAITSILVVSIIAVLGLILTAVIRRTKGEPLTSAFGRSLTEQLAEIERLRKEEIIPQDLARIINDALLERLRKQHGIPQETTPPKAPPGPALSKAPG